MDQRHSVGLDRVETPPKSNKFPRRKKMYNGKMYVGIDEEYSVDEILDTLRRRNLESFEKDSDSDGVDSPRKEHFSVRDSLDVSTSTVDMNSLSTHGITFLELRDLLDRRVSDARFDVVENKIDRVMTSLKGENSTEQKQLLKLMLARIKDLEEKLDKKTALRNVPVNVSVDPLIEAMHSYSTYLVEKATQTPSKDHDCEGVYVLVSKKNNQHVRQVHRHLTYILDDKMRVKPRDAYYYVHRKPRPLERKYVRRVGDTPNMFTTRHGTGRRLCAKPWHSCLPFLIHMQSDDQETFNWTLQLNQTYNGTLFKL
ncbi:hypothetical protein QZH41_003543 [Actinostola sp. cb2023]|nr:hypothetical protein QZH41_003543 [Actinostola sp. cb2023]